MPREETCNDVMSEERQRWKSESEQWKVPKKRECPLPKPGGLIGQVLGVKKAEVEEVEGEEGGVSRELERVRRKRES